MEGLGYSYFCICIFIVFSIGLCNECICNGQVFFKVFFFFVLFKGDFKIFDVVLDCDMFVVVFIKQYSFGVDY